MRELTLQEIQNRLQPVLHPGIKLVKVEEVDLREKPIQVRICGAWYSSSSVNPCSPSVYPKK